MSYDCIPSELKALRQWVCHRFPNKIPLCPIPDVTGALRPASCGNQATWSSFDVAVKAVKEHGATGVGIEFANGICGVDIDDCVDGGEVSQLAREIIETLKSYTEISPSGTGIHILCKGHLPDREGNKDSKLGLEMYDKGRYFTVTGHAYMDANGAPYPFRDCTKELDLVQLKYLAKEPAQQLKLGQAPKSDEPRRPPTQVTSTPLREIRDLSDKEILEIAFHSKNGEKMKRLYEGSYTSSNVPQRKDGSDDLSAIDLMLANHLAYWFNNEHSRMDTVFRNSALFRKKWDRSVGGGQTYGQRTLQEATKGRTQTFIPYERQLQRDQPPLPEPPPAPPAIRETVPLPESKPSVTVTADPTKYTLDDTGNAYRFRDVFWQDVRYDHVNGQWLYWMGKRWATDQTGEVKRRANTLLEEMDAQAKEEMNTELQKHVRKTRSSKYKESMLKEVQPLEGIPILPNELNRYSALLNLNNGILNLKTGELGAHRRELKLSLLADVEYDADAQCPRWMKFLDEVTRGDTELALYLQRMVGYCLTASTREQCVFFLWGSGGNGKSKFIDTVISMFGDYTKNCTPETVMIKDRSGSASANTELARMKSVRLVTTSEPDGGCRLAEGLLKRMTGEDVITARRLYQESFDFKPEFKIIMATNVRPIITGSDQGIWRRIRLIPFTAQISPDQMDKNLGEKLLAEKQGVFRWAVQGAMDWYKYGLPECTVVDYANKAYRQEMDKMKQFVDDCLVISPGHTLPGSQLYAVYRAWCEEHGERYPMTNAKFATELQDNYHFSKRKTSRFNEYQSVDFSDVGLQFLHLAPSSPH